MDMNKNVIIGGIIVIVLLVAGWWLTTKPQADSMMDDTGTKTDSSMTEDTGSSQTSSTPSMVSSGESVTVYDQAAGDSVNVASVTLKEMGWVAIRDADGRVLGAARFDAGTHQNVSVPLLRGTTSGGVSYQVLLYADDGDKEYDLHKDVLITGANGGVAGTNFKTL